MSNFKFELKSEVAIVCSGEQGTVEGRAEYPNSSNSYLIQYKAADGRAVTVWWVEEALTVGRRKMRVRYTGCSNAQVAWGNNSDPMDSLVEGEIYVVGDVEVHSWHTKYRLEGIEGCYNSTCFEEVP